MGDWFGASWATIGWVAATTTAMYATTVACVRIAGRRTLARLSAFDIIVTIALGSIIATTAVQESASYAQGATAIVTLLVLQTVVAAARQLSPRVTRLLDFPAEVVIEDGQFKLRMTPLGPQLTEGELRSRLREKGVFVVEEVGLVIMEPDGSVSVGPTDLPDKVLDPIVRR